MSQTFDLLLKGGEVLNHSGRGRADVGIINGKTVEIGDLGQASNHCCESSCTLLKQRHGVS